MADVLENQTAQFPPGTMLDDKYRIDRLLAVGGMGAVYVGEHTKLKKKVAIKVLRTELAGADNVVERFQREAIAASQIGHDNIVEVTDLGTTPGGVAFLVMEYLDGHNLADRIKKMAPLPAQVAADITTEILSAIAAAHAAGIVHRDLKPENVFLARKSRGETVKILDFGISRVTAFEEADHRLTRTGLVLGTPYYMSPEQARGESDIKAAADIYSIGVILYEMVTGKLPYEAENYNMLMFRVLSGDYVRPRALRDDLPEELEAVVVRAMALEPDQRFATADDFIAALAPFASAPEGGRSKRASFTGTDSGQPRITTSPGLSTAETLAADSVVNADTVAATTGAAAPAGAGSAAPVAAAPAGAGPAPRSRAGLFAALGGIAAVGIAAAVLLGGGDSAPATAPAPAPAPAAVEVAKPAPPPAEPTPVPAITIELVVTPPDAVIEVDGERIEGSSFERPADGAEHTIAVSADGYEPLEQTVTFDVNQRLQLALVASPRARSKPKSKPAADKPRDKPTRIISDSPYDD